MIMQFYKIVLLFVVCIVQALNASAQSSVVKINLVNTFAGAVSLGVETPLGSKSTFSIDASYQGWDVFESFKMRHILVQPELRWWSKYRYWRMFFGVHALYAQYNVGKLGLFGLDGSRVEGAAYGGGVSYGYQWVLANRLNLEATVGVGYARIDYKKYSCEQCGDFKGDGTVDHIGPTKLGVSLIYLL